jgi:hypothetical protein
VGTTFSNLGVPLLWMVVAKAMAFILVRHVLWLLQGGGVWSWGKPCLVLPDAKHDDVCGRRYLLGGMLMAFTLPSPFSLAQGNPRSRLLDQAEAAPRCRYLVEDVVEATGRD